MFAYGLVQVEAALRTALQLRRYDDILDPGLVYAFMALVGFYSGFYGTCSKVGVGWNSKALSWCYLASLHPRR